jgi:hypothetical protein
MLSVARTVQRMLPSRRDRISQRQAAESLDEFAPEPRLVPARANHRPATRQSPALAVAAAALAVAAASAVALGGSLVVNRMSTEGPRQFIAPSASPIEVEYPEYPGAPLLQTAAVAMPARLAAEARAEQLAAIEQAGARSARDVPRPAVSRKAVAPEAVNAFDVRGPIPQAASTALMAIPIVSEQTTRPADSPPRRIGPPIAITTLGGTVARNGRIVLVLEVTEQGEVARIVSREAVDVHSDVIDTVSTAARAWRYEPARRDGVAVPARVRVVVQLNGGDN